MLPLPKTKIVCTIGPSSWIPEVMKQLIENGMTVARVNGAFASVDEMKKIASVVRSLSNEIALMIDIKGHEVRLNKFEKDFDVKAGDTVVFGNDDSEYIYVSTFPDLYKSLRPGINLLVDDGNTSLIVEKIENKKIYAKVIYGNKIPKGKSLNVPGIFLDNPPITERDMEQIRYAVEDKWDFVAASFVRCKADVDAVKYLLKGTHTKVISKIEDSFGVQNIDEIIEASEGIMVARGDLAVEIPFAKVPHVQKEIIKKCNKAVKPVIVATQMLESMIKNPRPTRAEISDIANAIYDGADAVMLSGESTTGDYPVECVKVMKSVALETERYLYHSQDHFLKKTVQDCSVLDEGTEIAMAVAQSVANLSFKMPDAKIIVDTRTGFSAKLISSYNIQNTVIAMTPYDYYARRLAMVKGIKGISRSNYTDIKNMYELEKLLIEDAKNKKLIQHGDRIILMISSSYNFESDSQINEKSSIKIVTI
ncbi:MAG: pyruvate kinase [bacterium]